MKEISLRSMVLDLLSVGAGLANMLGNLAILMFGDRIFGALGVPPPADRYAFTGMACLSFTMGVAVLYAARAPERNQDLFKVAALGKSLFALMTFTFHATAGLHGFWLLIGAFDGALAVVFLLQIVRLTAPDLSRMQQGCLLAGLPRPRARRALIFTFSLTGTGHAAVSRLKVGLEKTGYRVDVQPVRPLEPIFRFPMSSWDFTRIVVRALLRIPAPIAPLRIPADHAYDLLVVEAQTWLVGASAPIEAIFQDPDNRLLFAGRDAAALSVCRGAHRRNQAMVVRWLGACGANVVAARGFAHQGSEPSRLFRLWHYLIAKGQGGVAQRYGLSEAALDEIERFGEALGRRPGRVPVPSAPALKVAA